jgi:hypothetical protein
MLRHQIAGTLLIILELILYTALLINFLLQLVEIIVQNVISSTGYNTNNLDMKFQLFSAWVGWHSFVRHIFPYVRKIYGMADIWETMADIWETMADIWEFHEFCTFGHMGKYGGHMRKYGGHMGKDGNLFITSDI